MGINVKPFIALFRGLNVGGHNQLPMQELTMTLENLGLQNIKTYIQSGNVVFDSEETSKPVLKEKICQVIQQKYGFSPLVMLLSPDELEKAITSNPFPEAEEEPKTLHVYFLESTPQDPDLAHLEAVRRSNERFSLHDHVFYLHAPDGIGRSKLAASVEKALGVPATARNWRSVNKIYSLAKR